MDTDIDPERSPRAFDTITFAAEPSTLTKSGFAIRATATQAGNQAPLGLTPVEQPAPDLHVETIATRHVVALDVLEHVVDEEAWLHAWSAMLEPGGTLVVRVPGEGPLAWLDAPNAFRYIQDIVGGGQRPLETRMKGWHRHYRRDDFARIVREAGLRISDVQRSGSPHHDLIHLGALAWGSVVRGDREFELRALNRRRQAEAGEDLPRLGPLSTRITIRAVKMG